MNEVQIWNHVLKWGLDQNPGLPSDPESFTENDFSTLKILYNNFLIEKFYLRHLVKLFLDHDHKQIDQSEPEKTKEIEPEAQAFEKIFSRQVQVIFQILSHRYLHNKFRKACNNQARTVTIIKVRNSNEILEGYSNPIEWKTGGIYVATYDSFIFSFDNKSVENHILSRVRNTNFTISHHSSCGLSFEEGDLILRGSKLFNNSVCTKASYDRPIRNSNSKFSVEELEVFQNY
ncbi:uncharacterized protein OCT59_020997 [Rhizophagus irregularis]|uniref:uncharacterized protein n=1 Tax=Rhizophagus irregularis TaxID=588596 RepID=UPI003328D372|nr:hypothetical protein OCT59_020997 [Rhizophagus irregularis]